MKAQRNNTLAPMTGRRLKILLWGLSFTVISLLFFLLPELGGLDIELMPTDFRSWVVYALALLYGVIIGSERYIHRAKEKHEKTIDRRHYHVFLILFMISCFTLNDEILLFSPFAPWALAYLALSMTGFLLLMLFPWAPDFLRHLTMFLLGMGVVMCGYLSLYLIPGYPIGIVGMIMFGFGFHVFVPVLSLIAFIRAGRRQLHTPYIFSFLAGIAVPCLIVGITIVRVLSFNASLDLQFAALSKSKQKEYPEWVGLGQYLPSPPVAILEHSSGKAYDRVNENWNTEMGFDLPTFARTSHNKIHDPLVMISSLFIQNDQVSYRTVKTAWSKSTHSQHRDQRRLWRGHKLETHHIQTQVDVYPEQRLAYTEMTLDIRHKDKKKKASRTGSERNTEVAIAETEVATADFGILQDRNAQEAVYTFHLPEGSAATALYLWVNGEKRPARFSTRKKADSAYVSIVGRERRDPALLHWQEGNTLVVTVFPCTPQLNRRFSIGITSPLVLNDGKLGMEDVWMEGPSTEDANHQYHLHIHGSSDHGPVRSANLLMKVDPNNYVFEGHYQGPNTWTLPAPAIGKASFQFGGSSYQSAPLKNKSITFDPEIVILDLNRAWKKSEFDKIWEHISHKKVFVWKHSLIRMTAENKAELFSAISKANFGLFPLYYLKHPEKTLLITKSTGSGPRMKDLRNTEFDRKTREWASKIQVPLQVFNLNSSLERYLQSLHDFKTFNLVAGNPDQMIQLLKAGVYPVQEAPDRITLPMAGMTIEKSTLPDASDSSQPDSGPAGQATDHLMRLYNYHALLKAAGPASLHKMPDDTALYKMAEQAYVASPFTSLIVLETDLDYERFGIKESDNSLANAKAREVKPFWGKAAMEQLRQSKPPITQQISEDQAEQLRNNAFSAEEKQKSEAWTPNNAEGSGGGGLLGGGGGSVPEPHEWALLIFFLLVLTFRVVSLRNRPKTQNA